jgi:hypothetical protein
MNKLAVIFVLLSFQCGHGIKFVDKSSAQLMQQTTQIAEESWPSLSAIIDDVDFGLDSNLFEASDGEGVGVNAAEADKHAEQVMADTLLQMRSTNFKEALSNQSEFQAMSDAQKHQYYEGSESLHRLSKSLGLARFMTEGVPKLVTSMKQDAPFMAFLDDAVEKLPQPADQSVEAGTPLLKELSKTAPRVAKYMMPKISELLKSDGHVALLQEGDVHVPDSSTGSVGDTGGTGDEQGEVEESVYENEVPRTVAYLRFQTGFHVPIPLNPTCNGGVCVYFDLGLLLVKLIPYYNSRVANEKNWKKGPCFVILRPGLIFRMTWGVMHVRAYLPTKKVPLVLTTQKWGWEAGYTYSPGDLPSPGNNTLQKYGGWLLGMGPAFKHTVCSTKGEKQNLDSFDFVEPMLGFKVSWLGETTMWTPMVRTGHSAEDTGHQKFALIQPITISVGKALKYPKNVGVTIGMLLAWNLPPSKQGQQCSKEVPPEEVKDSTSSGASEDATQEASI